MARTKKQRSIQRAPNYSGFKPFGVQKPVECEVKLSLEEYESMKLCDYEMLNHEDAANMMKVSRPTFTRIYQSARQKLAKALVEVSVICIEGGHATIDIIWYTCAHCRISFDISGDKTPLCPLCGTDKVTENK